MKNKDFRLFDMDNLPYFNDSFIDELRLIGSKLYTDQKQKLKFKTKLIEKYGSKCAYCGTKITNEVTEQIDHFTPRSESNVNDPKNLLLTCFQCNNPKRKVTFSQDLYPYHPSFSLKFKRDSIGHIVPCDANDLEAQKMAHQLKFDTLSRTITYIYLLIDYFVELLESKENAKKDSLVSNLFSFKKKLEDNSKLLCINDSLGD